MCKHDEWMKICVLCGDVLETTENKASIVTSAEMNKTVYVAAQHSVQKENMKENMKYEIELTAFTAFVIICSSGVIALGLKAIAVAIAG